MKTYQNIAQKITTNVTINAALQQALKILQMSNVELNSYIEQQALENPFLAVETPVSVPLIESQGFSVGQSNGYVFGHDEGDEGALWEKTLAQPENVTEKIVSTINVLFTQKQARQIALVLFRLLDHRGFFTVPTAQLSKALQVNKEAIDQVLNALKNNIDPPGVFAADWKESVLLQLRAAEENTEFYGLVLEHFQDILQGKISKVLSLANVTSQQLYAALKRIKNINPFPLAISTAAEPVYVRIPDIIVSKQNEQTWQVVLNQDALPKVVADKVYFSSIKPFCQHEEEKVFVRQAFQKASWLVKAIDQRYQNILKIAEVLVKRQVGFLEQGPKLLNPMTLKDVAVDAGVHESTVSRAINEKYIQTPQGIFSLKYFFSQAISGSFKDYSSEAIRKQIKDLIHNEQKPLSDEQISEILNNLGIDIARRTVTKYRESMSIPSSTERRRIKKITAQN